MKKLKKCSKGNIKQLSGLMLTLTVACTSVAPVTATTVSDGSLQDTLEYEVPEIQVSEGQTEEGQIEEGQTEEGQTEEGQTEEGQTEEGQTEEGQTEEGQTEEGQTEEGQTEEGQTEEGQTEEGQTEDDQKLEGFSGNWSNNGVGSWELDENGVLTSNNRSIGDTLYMSDFQVGKEDTYVVETTVKISDGDAAGIVFASPNKDTGKWSCFNANKITGQAKIFGDCYFKESAVSEKGFASDYFDLKVEVIGGKQVNTYVNDELFETVSLEGGFEGGYVGVMTWQSNATFTDFKVQKFDKNYSLDGIALKDSDDNPIEDIEFNKGDFSYKVVVPSTTESVKLDLGNNAPSDDEIEVLLNGTETDIDNIDLEEGNNVITIKLTDGNINYYTEINIYKERAGQTGFETNLAPFTQYGDGEWILGDKYVSANNISAGDTFYMSSTNVGENDTYAIEGEFEIVNGQAAGIVFGAPEKDNPWKSWYCLNIDTASGVSKLLGSGTIANEYHLTAEDLKSNVYKLKVEVIAGKQINAYLNDKLIATKTDAGFTGGYVGMMTFKSETIFNSFNLTKFDKEGYHLDNLTINDGDVKLSPNFSSDTFLYNATVPNETSSVALGLTPNNDTEFSVSVNGKNASPKNVPLKVGNNKVEITSKIKSQDETTEFSFNTIVNIYRSQKDGEEYTEDYRPQYHFSPQNMWCNDPNGMVYFNNEWHLFYQYHPGDKIWGPMHWGHAVSKDLIHWEELDVALFPDKIGAIYSGSAVVDKNNTSGLFDGIEGGGLVAIFTYDSSEGQKQGIAYSTDGREWTKYEGNPVIPAILTSDGEGNVLEDKAFRDPKVFWHEESNQWMMVVAGGPLRFYSSKDLIHWNFESGYDNAHPQYRPDGVDSIYTECPDFYKLEVGDTGEYKWVLNGGGRFYMVGDFKYDDKVGGYAFFPEGKYEPNYGKDSYAAMTYYGADGENGTPDGRRIMINWMNNWDYCNDIATITDPYNGSFTLQSEVTLEERNGEIIPIQTPIKEYEGLRKNATEINTTLTPDGANPLAEFKGDQYEIVAEFTPDENTTQQVGFKLRTGNGQETLVYYDFKNGKMHLDRTKSGKSPEGKDDVFLQNYSQKTSMTEDGKIKMHIYVDWSSVEVYGNDGETVGSAMIFPDPTSVGAEIYTVGGDAKVNATIYELDGIWNNVDNEEGSSGGSSGGSSSSSSVTRYTITAEAGEGGTISPDGSTSVKKGNSQVYTITANEGYAIEDVIVDGESVGAVEKYTFDTVSENHTIEVVFYAVTEESKDENIDEDDVPLTESPVNFADVNEKDWFYDAVSYAYKNGLVNGYSEDVFAPNENITRAMFVQILYNKDGQNKVDTVANFTDVNSTAWYADAINWAVEKGIISGYGDGKFGPDDYITREQIAVIMNNYAQKMGYTLPKTVDAVKFIDEAQIGAYANDSIKAMQQAGIIFGREDNSFDPKAETTRAEATAILYRFINIVNDSNEEK